MSTAEMAARAVKHLEPEEFKVLRAFDALLKDHESATIPQLATKARMHVDRVTFGINRLNQMELIVKGQRGYSLLMAGLDALALKILADRHVVVALGRSIGVGKESDVFEVYTPSQDIEAIKFFRIGRISFRDVRRKRGFKESHHWLLVNMDAAKKEFSALKILYGVGVRVPRPLALAKHVVVMQLIKGRRLIHCDSLDDPLRMLLQILENIKLAYRGGLISADLSEYNVLYDGSDPWIIDWPQSISLRHPNADLLLRRDIRNILKFFQRKYHLEHDLDDAFEYVTS
jgi:RIO kinase 2